jgi:hypothetical protein
VYSLTPWVILPSLVFCLLLRLTFSFGLGFCGFRVSLRRLLFKHFFVMRLLLVLPCLLAIFQIALATEERAIPRNLGTFTGDAGCGLTTGLVTLVSAKTVLIQDLRYNRGDSVARWALSDTFKVSSISAPRVKELRNPVSGRHDNDVTIRSRNSLFTTYQYLIFICESEKKSDFAYLSLKGKSVNFEPSELQPRKLEGFAVSNSTVFKIGFVTLINKNRIVIEDFHVEGTLDPSVHWILTNSSKVLEKNVLDWSKNDFKITDGIKNVERDGDIIVKSSEGYFQEAQYLALYSIIEKKVLVYIELQSNSKKGNSPLWSLKGMLLTKVCVVLLALLPVLLSS